MWSGTTESRSTEGGGWSHSGTLLGWDGSSLGSLLSWSLAGLLGWSLSSLLSGLLCRSLSWLLCGLLGWSLSRLLSSLLYRLLRWSLNNLLSWLSSGWLLYRLYLSFTSDWPHICIIPSSDLLGLRNSDSRSLWSRLRSSLLNSLNLHWNPFPLNSVRCVNIHLLKDNLLSHSLRWVDHLSGHWINII